MATLLPLTRAKPENQARALVKAFRQIRIGRYERPDAGLKKLRQK
jgi:hypothetical protein